MMGEFYEAVSGCEDLKTSSSHLYSHRQLFGARGRRCELRCEEVTVCCSTFLEQTILGGTMDLTKKMNGNIAETEAELVSSVAVRLS